MLFLLKNEDMFVYKLMDQLDKWYPNEWDNKSDHNCECSLSVLFLGVSLD